MSLIDTIAAELALKGLRMAADHEPDSYLEPTSAGLVRCVEEADDPSLAAYAAEWDAQAEASRGRAYRLVITPQIVYDTWRDGCDGGQRVAAMIAPLTPRERAGLEVGYWNLLRQRHTPIPLIQVRAAFELVLCWYSAV